jgi:hypothetical protein
VKTGSPAYRVGLVALLVIVGLVVVQPLGVFWHFVHDHLGEHSRTTHDGLAVHVTDDDAPDHDTDHCHMWMTPADAAVTPQVRQPKAVATAGLFKDAPLPSAPQFPPFSPPRA